MKNYAKALTDAGIEFDPKASPAELKALAAHHKLEVPDEKKAEAAPVEEQRYICKVIVPRLEFRAGVAARGARICLREGDAKLHESRGAVKILGLK